MYFVSLSAADELVLVSSQAVHCVVVDVPIRFFPPHQKYFLYTAVGGSWRLFKRTVCL